MILVQIILVKRMEYVKKSSIQIVHRTFALVIVVTMAFTVNIMLKNAATTVRQNQSVNQNTVE
jgi:heme A synthase